MQNKDELLGKIVEQRDNIIRLAQAQNLVNDADSLVIRLCPAILPHMDMSFELNFLMDLNATVKYAQREEFEIEVSKLLGDIDVNVFTKEDLRRMLKNSPQLLANLEKKLVNATPLDALQVKVLMDEEDNTNNNQGDILKQKKRKREGKELSEKEKARKKSKVNAVGANQAQQLACAGTWHNGRHGMPFLGDTGAAQTMATTTTTTCVVGSGKNG